MESLDESLAILSRMSSKQGVQSTLILKRDSGAIVRIQGMLAPDRTHQKDETGSPTPDENTTRDGGEIARHVWKFVQASDSLIESMDSDDELRLLRIRTRRNELVIVPSQCGY
jgi:dynein light chain roadblock-type